MFHNKLTASALLVAGAALAMPLAAAATPSSANPFLVVEHAHDVTHLNIPYVSGGIGINERQAMDRMSKDFNLKLEFARKDGDYLANVHVAIKDRNGNPVLKDVTNGPWLMADLPRGTYEVTASGFGEQLHRTLHVPARGQKDAIFYWG